MCDWNNWFFGKYFELMSVYYFVRASVVINYVNKNINNSQTRSEQNMQNIYADLLLHIFGFCSFCLGGNVEVKPKYCWDRNSWMWLPSCWRRACLCSAEVAVKMSFLLALGFSSWSPIVIWSLLWTVVNASIKCIQPRQTLNGKKYQSDKLIYFCFHFQSGSLI